MSEGDEHLSEHTQQSRTPSGSVEPFQHRERRRSRWVLVALILIAAGIALILGVGWVKYRRVRTCLDSSLAHMHALQNLVPGEATQAADLDMREVGIQLHGLQDDLACLQAEVREFLPLAPLLRWLPKYGPDVANAPTLLAMAQALVDGGVLIFDGLSPLVDQLQPADPSASNPGQQSLDLRLTVAALDAAEPSLAAAEVELQRAAQLQTGLNTEALSPRIARLLDLTERYLPLLRTGMSVAQISPELLGARGERTYLILAQNDDERRPTGGWISGMGLLTIAQGQITEVNFSDSWAVDNLNVPHEIPPDSMFRVLWAEIWLFRDANWSPDFPASAQVAERILERDQGISVDGVIAVDQRALQMLVAAMEPLAVESSEEPITGANVLTYIRHSWSEPQEGVTSAESWAEWATHRKDFMADLVAAMLDKVQNRPQGLDLTKVANALWRGLRERHILVYLHGGEAADLLASLKWDGALVETQGDYLQVVDANVGFNKVDPNVQRTITYKVDLTDPASARAEVTVHYQNKSQRTVETCLQQVEWLMSYEERMHGCYWNYVRVYVPEGASLLTSERESLPSGSLLSLYHFALPADAGPDTGPVEKGKVPFGLFFLLEPGGERDVRLPYRLPAGLVQKEGGSWRYQLLVQKQAGALAVPLRLMVSLPPNSRLVTARPDPFSVQPDAVAFELSLGMDQEIEVLFQNGGVGGP